LPNNLSIARNPKEKAKDQETLGYNVAENKMKIMQLISFM
jgi:hypothetical protein